MSVHSFFRRLTRNDDSQLLPTVAVPTSPPYPPPKLSRHAKIPLRDISHSGMTGSPYPLPVPYNLVVRDAEAFQVLAREENHLRESLQAAIDAQSDGLLAGFANATAAPAASATSSIPDAMSSTGRHGPGGINTSEYVPSRNGGRGIVMPVRQPVPQRMGLQGARKGIARAMAQLEELKGQEGELLEGALAAREEDIAAAEALGQKKEGLEASIRAIETEDSSRQVQGLCEEERSLSEEIRNLEAKLAEMRTRHRHLRDEIKGLDNRVQSQLSSYRAALALAEKETKNFLTRPSASAQMTTTTTTLAPTSGTKGNQSLWDLPVGRRTLPMAQEQFRDEQRTLLKRIAEVDEERTALEEGKQVWAEVVQEVTSVEQLLRDEMQRLDQQQQQQQQQQSSSFSTQLRGLPTEASVVADGETEAEVMGREEGQVEEDNAHNMHTILQHIDTARKRVEQHWHTSVARQWGLLVCCVGAELEALVQGSAVLRATLGGEGVGGEEIGMGEVDNLNTNGLDLNLNLDTDIDIHTNSNTQRENPNPNSTDDPPSPSPSASTSAPPAHAHAHDAPDEDEDEDEDEDAPGADLLGLGLGMGIGYRASRGL